MTQDFCWQARRYPHSIALAIRAGDQRSQPAKEQVSYSVYFAEVPITFLGCQLLQQRTRTQIATTDSGFTLNAATAGEALVHNARYMLRVQPRIATTWLSSGNALIVTASNGNPLPNNPPTLNTIANPPAINVDSSEQSIALSGISAGEGESQSLTITAASSNNALIPNPVVIYDSISGLASVRYTPVANASGTATITVTVNDGQTENNSISRSFNVTVNPVDDALTVSGLSNLNINEDTNITIPFTLVDPDSVVTAAKITVASNNSVLLGKSALVLSGTGAARSIRITPTANRSGTAQVTLTIVNLGITTTHGFLVTVTEVNDVPSISKLPKLKSLKEDALPVNVNITGISSGLLESQALQITAESSNPSILPHPTITHIPFSATAIMNYVPAPNAHGTVNILLTLDDGQSANNRVTYTIPVTISAVNDSPTLSPISSLTVAKNTPIPAINITINDVETSPEFLTVVQPTSKNTKLLPTTGIVLGGTGSNRTITLTPLPNVVGSTEITVTVRDEKLTAVKKLPLTVTE